jgi:hypothetical protein
VSRAALASSSGNVRNMTCLLVALETSIISRCALTDANRGEVGARMRSHDVCQAMPG